MEMSQAAFSGPLLLLVGGLLFVLLFGVIQQALKMSSFFRGATSYAVATCVSLICVISLFRTFAGGKGVSEGGNGGMIDFILLPYAALAIAALLVLLLMAFNGRSHWFLVKPYRRYYHYLEDEVRWKVVYEKK